MPGKYHHRDLRAELVRVSLDLIAECGIAAFSVAEAARRAKVSSAAPYRHFPDRTALLAAVATTAACRLRDDIEEAVAAETDPVARGATIAAVHTRFLIDTRIGLQVIYAEGLGDPKYTELHEARRDLVDAFLMRCIDITHDPATALELMEQLNTQAFGYGELYLNGVNRRLGYPPEQVAAKSRRAARIVIEAYQAGNPSTAPADPW
ncbi:TetR/AcrR family transcriptional regulator [Amycolatopsis jiangsuensis]|uniref:AcrR family transcriptional regulator n=1 Tax=Amycolatopsis jiangsuensis TaxID=1181879 RepID=A0A840IZL7_9PSEU|nr:TetR/AcrR family transcriptional regulator [Amycolatopsis jiangsuensis]MBB4686642.1 AcrR family transcriptional regulator [Amycolatopsis jiangsuensis]